jgi:hypothetical protein
MYIIRSMRVSLRVLTSLVLLVSVTGCRAMFGREYEYEEQLYLDVDGSAAVTVNASIPSLVELRGLPLDPAPRARFEPLMLRRALEANGCQVARIGAPWFRNGRRFAHIRVVAADAAALSRCSLLSWSTYRFTRQDGAIQFQQKTGAPAGGAAAVTWTGNELVAFRMHLPSRISFHNVRRLQDNTTGEADRGNILTWEQRLADRRAGVPLDMQVTMDPQSILYRTLWLFAGSFAAAMLVLAALIWWTVRKGKARLSSAKQSRA